MLDTAANACDGNEIFPTMKWPQKRRKIDGIVGKTFGYLLVVESLQRRGSWKCTCVCGKDVVARGPDLVSGRYVSCGCKFREEQSRRRTLPNEMGIKNVAYSRYSVEAARRKLEFSLTMEEFLAIVTKPCAYCGFKGKFVRRPKNLSSVRGEYSTFRCNGIDRYDNSIGYVNKNCVPCCSQCNRAKGTMHPYEWNGWLDRVLAYRSSHGRL